MSACSDVTVIGLRELAAFVKRGDRVAARCCLFTRPPLALAREVAAQRPTELTYPSSGGGPVLETLVAAGLAKQACISFSSLDLFGLAPRFRAAAESGALDIEDLNALAMIRGPAAPQQNLPSLPFQLPARVEA